MTHTLTEAERELYALIEQFNDDPANGNGGNLHIILEDQNAEAEHVQWCLDRCNEAGDTLGADICTRLLALPYNRRYRASSQAPYVDLAEPPHWYTAESYPRRTGEDGGGALIEVYRSQITIYPDDAECYEDAAILQSATLIDISEGMLWHENDWRKRTGKEPLA